MKQHSLSFCKTVFHAFPHSFMNTELNYLYNTELLHARVLTRCDMTCNKSYLLHVKLSFCFKRWFIQMCSHQTHSFLIEDIISSENGDSTSLCDTATIIEIDWTWSSHDPFPARCCSRVQDREVNVTILYDPSHPTCREIMVHGKPCGKLSASWVSFIQALIIVHLVQAMMYYAHCAIYIQMVFLAEL